MKTRTNQPVVADETPNGTLAKVLGVDASGNIVKGDVSGGTQLYKHSIESDGDNIIVISTISTPVEEDDATAMKQLLKTAINITTPDGDTLIYHESNDYLYGIDSGSLSGLVDCGYLTMGTVDTVSAL